MEVRTRVGVTAVSSCLCHDGPVQIRDLAPAADAGLVRDLLLLQRGACACEAALIGDRRIPPLHEGLDDLVRAPLLRVGDFAGGHLVGALGHQDAVDHLEIDRLVVAPSAPRRGTGSALVREALHRAGPERVVVATGRDDHPARALCERLRFSRASHEEVLPGLWITRYEHVAAVRPPRWQALRR